MHVHKRRNGPNAVPCLPLRRWIGGCSLSRTPNVLPSRRGYLTHTPHVISTLFPPSPTCSASPSATTSLNRRCTVTGALRPGAQLVTLYTMYGSDTPGGGTGGWRLRLDSHNTVGHANQLGDAVRHVHVEQAWGQWGGEPSGQSGRLGSRHIELSNREGEVL